MKRRKQRGMSSGRMLTGMLVFCMAVGTTAGQTGLVEVRAAEVQQEEGGEASAQAESDFQYSELQDGTLEITKYSGTDAEVVVPREIDGKRVTSIGGWTFNNCSSLTNITLPEGLTSIGELAFNGCSSLTNITFPEGLTSIGHQAFGGCSSLTDITFPEGLTSIDRNTFYGCSGLRSVVIPESVTNIGR